MKKITSIFFGFLILTNIVQANQSLYFKEIFDPKDGWYPTYKITDILESKQTDFQNLAVYNTPFLGKILVLDNVLNVAEHDEQNYHEMIAHVPMMAHPNPERVLIVGGGDGGTAREVLKHPSVKEVVVCDLDNEVIEVSKKHLPTLAVAFDDKRTTVINEDAAQYIKTKENYFDVVIVDSCDPVGPAVVLFQTEFYKNVYNALTKDGVVSAQIVATYAHDLLKQLYDQNKTIFKHMEYYTSIVPSYSCGEVAFAFCSKNYGPTELLDSKHTAALGNLHYYNKNLHRASFSLPESLIKKLAEPATVGGFKGEVETNDDNYNHLLFSEKYETSRGIFPTLGIKKVLESKQTDFQKLEVFETVGFGNMLVLDDVIQVTQADNHGYHEMIAHVPLIAHPNPKRVLIVGGGDGGTMTAVLQHSSVEEVVLCEIDPECVNVGKKYFPEFASSFNDPRVEVRNEDAAKYIEGKKDYFDVIIVDSSDPIGPAIVLFQEKFYRDIYNALTHDGIAVTQSESMFYDAPFIKELHAQNKSIFEHTYYYYTTVITYPSSSIGFSFCSKKYSPFKNIDAKRIDALKNRHYYNEGRHRSSFVLPTFMGDALRG